MDTNALELTFPVFLTMFGLLWFVLSLDVLLYYCLPALLGLFIIFRFIIPARRKDVSKEIILITGAGSGIGRSLSLKFARLGATVVLWDINKSANDAVAEEINSKTPNKAFSYQCDCTKREEVYKVAEQVKKEVGDVTILVNNAGVVSGKKFHQTPDEKIELTFKVNILAHFWTLKAFLPAMMEKNHGHIVTMASAAGLLPLNGLVDYCASKHAAVGLHSTLTVELYAQNYNGIHTTCVCPGHIDSGMFEGFKTNEWFVPTLTVDYAADRIIKAVQTNQHILMMPGNIVFALFLHTFLPVSVTLFLSKVLGGLDSMNTFRGRQKQE